MIKLILSGGLGNQMFQYAAARALSLRLGTDISADLYMFKRRSKAISRQYCLDIFDIELPESSSYQNKLIVKAYKYLAPNKFGRGLFDMMHIFNESAIQAYDERFDSLPIDCTLLGYFQNEKYFQAYEKEIRNDFIFKNKLDSKNLRIMEQIGHTNSVSIHIRRGDYLNTSSNLQVLDINYYQRALAYIKKKVKDPVFFIFSDDIDWVKQNLHIGECLHSFIDWNTGEYSYVDMQLISCCKHNIIANSSFSWWGAWLNEEPQKLVIAPSVWYKNQMENSYPDGFIPEGWVIL